MRDLLEPLESRKRRRSVLANTLGSLSATRDNLERALTNHRNFDPRQWTEAVSKLSLVKDQVAESLALANATLRDQHVTLQQLTARKVSFLKIRSYFSAEQKLLRSQAAAQAARVSESEADKKRLEGKLTATKAEIEQKTRELAAFHAFDAKATERELCRIFGEMASMSDDIAMLDLEISRINQKIGPLVTEYEDLQANVINLKETISAADSLDNDLSAADNSYERAQIHADCEERFGNGSPKKVRGDASRELRSIEYNLPKLERRIRDELKKFDMSVSHIIIDGNNACYERSTFIRLHALTHLVDELAKNYKVTVVFDASIRSLLKTDDAGITRIIGHSATVHVAPTRTGADEYILRLAEAQPESYVLSNDRFAEFSEFDAVKSGRLIRFMIANNHIMLNDLDIDIPFRTPV